ARPECQHPGPCRLWRARRLRRRQGRRRPRRWRRRVRGRPGDRRAPQRAGVNTTNVRHGVRLGIDPGEARIGVATSDPTGFLATPVETLPRGPGDLDRLAALVAELDVLE